MSWFIYFMGMFPVICVAYVFETEGYWSSDKLPWLTYMLIAILWLPLTVVSLGLISWDMKK